MSQDATVSEPTPGDDQPLCLFCNGAPRGSLHVCSGTPNAMLARAVSILEELTGRKR